LLSQNALISETRLFCSLPLSSRHRVENASTPRGGDRGQDCRGGKAQDLDRHLFCGFPESPAAHHRPELTALRGNDQPSIASISASASGESHCAGPAIVPISQPSLPMRIVVGSPISLPSCFRA
jgi:hypothetical protein